LIARPDATEYETNYEPYVSKVPDGDLLRILDDQRRATARLLADIAETHAGHRYAPDKWSIKEVVGHLTDVERVFSYRALRFARADRTPLAGFDEKAYAPAGRFDARQLADLARDLDLVRGATIALFDGFDTEVLARRGVANGKEISVRALAYVIAGHERHHVVILGERYLV
jgi:hypothetical protein